MCVVCSMYKERSDLAGSEGHKAKAGTGLIAFSTLRFSETDEIWRPRECNSLWANNAHSSALRSEFL